MRDAELVSQFNVCCDDCDPTLHFLGSWTFLLLFVQGQEGHVGYLDNLKSNTGNITDGMTLTTETSDQNFIVLLNVVQATVPWYECRDFLAVLDQLHPDALTDGRVGLLGFDSSGRKKRKKYILKSASYTTAFNHRNYHHKKWQTRV